MRSSIRMPLILAAGASMLLLAAATIVLSVLSLRAEVTALDLRDYSERIRNFEYDYRQVDAVSAASDEVYQIQQDLLVELENRYLQIEEARAYPFIVNGDSQVILSLPDSGVSDETLAGTVAPPLIERADGTGEIMVETIATPAFDGWVVASYFAPWDWITGYVMSDATRFAGVRELVARLAIAVAAGALLLFLIFGAILNRILRPVAPIEAALRRARDGDLTVRLGGVGRRELGRIAGAVDSVLVQFSDVIGGISAESRRTVEAGADLTRFADGALETFRTIGSRTTSIADHMGDLGAQVEDSTGRVADIAGRVRSLREEVDSEDAIVTELSAAMDSMEQALQQTVERAGNAGSAARTLRAVAQESGRRVDHSNALMQQTASRVDAVNDFIELIRTIAEQTSLLAMNAAIEAAHAGESGRGFAVVADEIQRLSATAEEHSEQVGTVLRELVESITEASRISSETADAFGQVESEISSVDSALSSIAAETETLEARRHELLERLERLRQSSERTRTDASTVDTEAQQIRESLETMDAVTKDIRRQIDEISEQSASTGGEIDNVQSLIAAVRSGAESLAEQVTAFSTAAPRDETAE